MAKSDKKVKIESTDADGKKKVVAVRSPTPKDRNEAQLHYLKAFRTSLESGAILRQKLEDYLREQGIWDDEKQKRYESIINDISDGERKLSSGGIKLSEARDVAISMRQSRFEFRELVAERTGMDTNTAESRADNASFDYLVSVCVVDPDTSKPIFANVDEYQENADQPFMAEAAGKLAERLYQLDPDYDKSLPENVFLTKYKFADDDLRLINKDGQMVDLDGKLVNKDGRYIDTEGNLIDKDGNPVDEEGNLVVDFSPFLDDDGKPVVLEEAEETKPKKTKKKKVLAEEEVEVDAVEADA